MAKSIRDVLEEFREHSLDERAKGTLFEQLMKDFLKTDTQYERLFDEVWLWSEYPERGNRADTGIDLVARERDTGELVAIQCKFYAPQTLISKPDIDSFLASSSKAEFQGRIFISTSDNWGKNAEEAIAGQKPDVARIGLSDLDNSSIDWDQFSFQTPDNLEKKPLKSPRPHQEEAIKAVLQGFQAAERGKLIMACGTGKTFTSLKLVERMFPQGGTVLFLVPSISLLSQALKEWTIECQIPLRSYAVCSDVSVGKRKNDEDLPVTDLAFPATTNTERLVQKFTEAGPNHNGLTVIFSTYQSIDVVAQAQSGGIPEFDLIICDEAHRTTGVTLSDSDESAFVKVHNQDFIQGAKRLYMTATPKVFSDASTKKAEEAGAVLADMGKPDLFGEEFHRLGFGQAVERGILTDYKVLVLAVDESYVAKRFQRQFADEDNSLKLEDAAKIVGCWNGLSKRSVEQEEFQIDPGAMRRAVAFSRSIAESKKIAEMFQLVVDEETSQLANDGAEYLRCEVEHVDGSFNSLARNEKLDWLKQDIPDNTARILSNARCLTEGVDVPALDAVMFLNPRDSQVDVVQAVGRVMRKLEGKKYGYVILPIGVPADMDPTTALDDNKKYKVVWQVLQALRSHDERFDAMVNKIDLSKKAPQIGIIGVGGGSDGEGQDDYGSFTLDFPNFDEWRDAILSKIVQKVGQRTYWENWAEDVAKIAQDHVVRISVLLEDPSSSLKREFQAFFRGLQDNLNPFISKGEAIEMLAQHLITKPVFDALFEKFKFTDRNPVSIVMQRMVEALEGSNLSLEREKLQRFYDSVRLRASGVEDGRSKQRILKELYQRFFKTAFAKDSDRLGIVYTPDEIVDFMLRITDDALRDYFGKAIADEDVHILDPFTGTGTYLVRLLQGDLIPDSDLPRKFRHELHANEIVLLAYYVAAINIEEAYHDRIGGEYEQFDGVVLTDTFQMYEQDDKSEMAGLEVFAENNSRVLDQKEKRITVVIGNPPYSAGQASSNDRNANTKYPTLDSRISQTFGALAGTKARNTIYDSYIRALRWALDRVQGEGLVVFVTNNGFLDSSTAEGIRRALVQESTKVFVINLRGNSRTFEVAKQEGGNVFDVRVGISILLVVKVPGAEPSTTVEYFEFGDFTTKAEKLNQLDGWNSLKEISWTRISPNDRGDWINQRAEIPANSIPLVDDTKKGGEPKAIFRTYSSGAITHRDAWVFNFSEKKLMERVQEMLKFYNSEVERLSRSVSKRAEARTDPSRISWSNNLWNSLERGKKGVFHSDAIREVTYRPFVPSYYYSDKFLSHSLYQLNTVFSPGVENFAILTTGVGMKGRFKAMAIDKIPESQTLFNDVLYPRWFFRQDKGQDVSLFVGDAMKVSAISSFARSHFSRELGVDEVSDDDIFFYVFGLLSHPLFIEQQGSNLTKELPSVPVYKEFQKIAQLGESLFRAQIGLENLEPFDATIIWSNPSREENWTLSNPEIIEMGDGLLSIRVNQDLELRGIPEGAISVKFGNRSATHWVLDRFPFSVDKKSGISNDAVDFFGTPKACIDYVLKTVTAGLIFAELEIELGKIELAPATREKA